eukprot:scaffold241031_cov16-Prasinocladus_malaysianus.AAC.1
MVNLDDPRTIVWIKLRALFKQVAIDGGVNCLETSEARDHALKAHHKGESELLYGTSNGQIFTLPFNTSLSPLAEYEQAGGLQFQAFRSLALLVSCVGIQLTNVRAFIF